MNSVFDKIVRKLSKYPEVKYEIETEMLTVFPENESGFEVSLYFDGENYTVYFEGWHREFESEEEALNCSRRVYHPNVVLKTIAVTKKPINGLCNLNRTINGSMKMLQV